MATDPTTIPSVADLQETKQYLNNINEFVSSENNTLVDRDGKTRRTLAGVNDAFDSMQSGELTAQAVDAADRAETAADVATINGKIFDTVALGVAGTANGDYFSVVSPTDENYLDLYKNESGSAVFQKSYPSTEQVELNRKSGSDALSRVNSLLDESDMFPVLDGGAVNPDQIVGGKTWVQGDEPYAGVGGIISSVEIHNTLTASSTSNFRLKIYEKEVSGSNRTFTLVDQTDVIQLEQGVVTLRLDPPLRVEDGQFIGFYSNNTTVDVWEYGAGSLYNTFNDTGDFSSSLPLNVGYMFAIKPIVLESGLEKEVDALSDSLNSNTELLNYIENDLEFTPIKTFGEDVLESATSTTSTDNFVFDKPLSTSALIKTISLYSATKSTVRFRVYSRSGNVFTMESEVILSTEIGLNNFDVNLIVEKGWYFGTVGSGIYIKREDLDPSSSEYYPLLAGGSVSTTTFTASQFGTEDWSFAIKVVASESYNEKVESAILEQKERIDTLSASVSGASSLPFEYNMILGSGQSNMNGERAGQITTVQEYGTLGFPYGSSSTTLSPATASSTGFSGNEWSGLGCASYLQQLIEESTTHGTVSPIVIDNQAQGGTRIEQTNKGTARYNNHITHATALQSETGSSNSGAMAVIYMQGETDGNTYPDQTNFIRDLKQLAADYNTDLKAVTGQTLNVPLFTYQQGRYRNNSLALLQATRESPLITMAAPIYQMPYGDNVHITAEAQRVMGAYFAKAIFETVVEGNNFEPLQPKSSRVSGNSIVLQFNKYGLVLDDIYIPQQKNYGFEVFNESEVEKTPTSVSVINSNEVKLTFSEAPQEGWVVKYGTPQVGIFLYEGWAGNLRDSAGQDESYDGVELHNWCVIFDYII